MTVKEKVRHDIVEAFDFIRFLMKHPKEVDRIRNGSEIDIMCKDFPTGATVAHREKIPKSTYISSHTFQRV